ncbi:MAG TPA: hypothetical protein VGN04_15770 [Herbaspirillum sp.]
MRMLHGRNDLLIVHILANARLIAPLQNLRQMHVGQEGKCGGGVIFAHQSSKESRSEEIPEFEKCRDLFPTAALKHGRTFPQPVINKVFIAYSRPQVSYG